MFSEVCLKHVQVICCRSYSFLGCRIRFFRFLFEVKLVCFSEIHQHVNDLVEKSISIKLFDLELTKFSIADLSHLELVRL